MTTFVVSVFSLIFFATPCLATNGQITLKADQTDLAIGDEITLTADLPDDTKLYALTAALAYDQNVFEPINDANFDLSDSSSVVYNSDNNQFGIINQSGKADQNLFSVRLRVKEGANVGDTNIALTNITSSDGQESTEYSPATVKISVTRDAAVGEVIPTSQENTITEQSIVSQPVFSSLPFIIVAIIMVAIIAAVFLFYRHTINPNNQKLYYYLAALGALIIALTIGLVSINNSKKDVDGDGSVSYHDAENIISYLIGIENQSSQEDPQSGTSAGQSSYQDAGSATFILASTQSTYGTPSSNTRPDRFDTNNDGQVDINDAGHNAEQAQKATTVALSDSDDQPTYVEKENTKFAFNAAIEPAGLSLVEAKVKVGNDGEPKYYTVEPEDDHYVVYVDPMTNAGKVPIFITEVRTSNDKTLGQNYHRELEVLKSTPAVSLPTYDKATHRITFGILDPDHAFKSGKVEVYNLSDKLEDPIFSENITQDNKDNIDFTPELSSDKVYQLSISASYCRTIAGDYECYDDVIIYTRDLETLTNFQFQLSDFSLSDYVKPSEKPIVSFVTNNSQNLPVKSARVRIDNNIIQEFTPTKNSANLYESTLDQANMAPGRHSVILESVTLEGDKTFTSPTDFQVQTDLTYFVPSNLPTVSGLELKHLAESNQINALFRLNDNHNTVSKLTLVLQDSTGNTITKLEIGRDDPQFTQIHTSGIDLAYPSNTKDRGFTVKVLADYDLGDKYTFTEQELATADIAAYDNSKLWINEIKSKTTTDGKDTIYTRYTEKNNPKFWLELNTSKRSDSVFKPTGTYEYNQIGGYTVNGSNYVTSSISSREVEPTGQNNYDYTATVNIGIPNHAGVIDLNVSRVQFIHNAYYHQYSNWYSIPRANYQIEVLRDMPKIENLTVEEDYANRRVAFHFDVVVDESATPGDESFQSGTLKFGDLEQTFTNRGPNTVVFEGDQVPVDEVRELIFRATFDRDSDTFNEPGQPDQNQYNDYILHLSQYGLLNPDQLQDVKIKNATALTNDKEINDNIFTKHSPIGLYFEITGLPERLNDPVKIKLAGRDDEFELLQIVDDEGYYLLNQYAAFIPGYSDAGNWSVKISDVILSSGKTVTISDTNSPAIAFEVLKDAPTISDFAYQKDGLGYSIKTKLNDTDKALVTDKTHLIITNDLGEEIYNKPYQESLSFEDDASANYLITITGDYNLSSSQHSPTSSYYHSEERLFNAAISTDEKYIELKDLTDINLYRLENSNLSLVDSTSSQTINAHLDQYFLELSMSNMPTIRVPIQEAREVDGHLFLILDSKYLTQEDGYKAHNSVKIDFGSLDSSGQAHNEFHPTTAFNKLIDDLKNNRNIELTRDYDASVISNSNLAYYVENYHGTLNGNGHSIKNLTSPLIGKLEADSKIENLVLEDVQLTGNTAKGALANTTDQVELKQILVRKVTSSSSGSQTGGLVGSLGSNSTIDSCGVTDLNLNVGGSQQVGGIVGVMGQDSYLKNSYASGTINGYWNYRGGLVGNTANNNTANIENSYAKVNLAGGGTSCGIGCTYAGRLNVSNSVSLSSNFGSAPISNNGQLTNNYFLQQDTGNTFTSTPDQQTLVSSKTDINKSLFEQAKFDSTIWRLDNDISYDHPPHLAFEKSSISGLEANPNYSAAKSKVYQNLVALSPYFESDAIVRSGNRLKNGALLDKQIRLITPLDADGKLVSYLTNHDQDKIKQLNIVYTDGSSSTYNVVYTTTYDMVATYRIPELHADYTFPRYIIDVDSRLVDNLTYYLKSLSYANNLDPLTAETDSRITRDFYNTTTKNELREFVLKYLANSNYTNTSSSEAIAAQIERDIKGNNHINQALYLYNFLHRYYDVKIGNTPLYDYLMFNMQGFDTSLSMDGVINKFFSNTAANFNTGQTNTTYKNLFASSTGLADLPRFLEFLVTKVGGISDMSDWVRSEFDGVLIEVSIDNMPDYDSDQGLIENPGAHNQNTGVFYTLWDHFSHAENNDENGYKGYNYILPLLTTPKNSTYIISMPVQFVIGSQRTYVANPDDPSLHERILFRAKTYAARYKKYFTTAYGILGNKQLFNDMHIIQIDKTDSYNSDGTKSRQRFGSSEEPHFKNFNEVVGLSPAEAGVNAASWGPYIEWQIAGVMDSILTEYYAKYQDEGQIWDTGNNTFGTWSHETAHSIDARLFLRNNGRRYGAGGEDYADGFLRQQFDSHLIVMNLSRNFGPDCGYGANCDPERVDTPEEIYDFYQKAFDTIYAIDYIEALAFLQLSSEDMASTGIQISYPFATGEDFSTNPDYANYQKYFPNGLGDPAVVEKAGQQAYLYTRYRQIDASEYDKMKSAGQLNDINDLYDNQLMIYPGIYQMSTRGGNSYGGEGLNVAHWYQPHNDYGRPDSYSLKWLSYEMMSQAGYDNGFIQYASNINPITQEVYTSFGDAKNLDTEPKLGQATNYKTDLLALRRVTGQDDITFETYKKGRFAEVAQNLKHLNTIIDVKAYVQKFYDALVSDAEYARTHPNASGTSMSESTKLRVEIYQALKNHTKDFVTDDIYGDQYTQGFTDINELRHLIENSPKPAP